MRECPALGRADIGDMPFHHTSNVPSGPAPHGQTRVEPARGNTTGPISARNVSTVAPRACVCCLWRKDNGLNRVSSTTRQYIVRVIAPLRLHDNIVSQWLAAQGMVPQNISQPFVTAIVL